MENEGNDDIDFAALSKVLHQNLIDKKVSLTDLCTKRHDLYKDCFDEVILELSCTDDPSSERRQKEEGEFVGN